ncbi:MAG: sigma-E processing peptidase SpoIIGA, partial [Clostridia bacterium]|nr:sigma-E processing peptidase SpoIIGA [Clostridia bacterium]
MEIYIEYALIENFLYDLVLLTLAFKAARVKAKGWKLTLSAGIGAV